MPAGQSNSSHSHGTLCPLTSGIPLESAGGAQTRSQRPSVQAHHSRTCPSASGNRLGIVLRDRKPEAAPIYPIQPFKARPAAHRNTLRTGASSAATGRSSTATHPHVPRPNFGQHRSFACRNSLGMMLRDQKLESGRHLPNPAKCFF